MSKELNASEAVYGFCGWLTTRKEKTVMSSSDDAAPIADLVNEFCAVNNLPEVSADWADNLKHPDEYDLDEMAWGIIANSFGGDWERATPEWKEAAEKWRDEYHKTLNNVDENIEEGSE